MKALTNRQQEVLSFIESYIREKKYPPTIREIAEQFGISAKGAHDHVKALEKKGKIRSDLNRSRAIEVIHSENDRKEVPQEILSIPILGSVAAGAPIFSEENFDGEISLPASMLKTGRHFGLRVRGDSMIDAGIFEGDLAIIRQSETAKNGEIVVAKVQEEAVTLKRFYKEANRIRLKAENPIYPPIYTRDLRILGILEHLIRNYG